MKKGNPSQNQKSGKADTQANPICSTFAFAQPHQKPTTISTFDTNFFEI
jgi:hypothetical protein